MLLTYTGVMNAAETGWGADNYDDRDVFYEKAWGSTFLLIAIITIVFTGFTSYRLIKLVNSYGIKSVEHNNAYNRQIVDVSRGMKLIKAFSIGEYVKSKLLKLNYKATEVQSKILITLITFMRL